MASFKYYDGSQWVELAKKSDIPSSLPANDVYSWAKQPNKPSYTTSEISSFLGLGSSADNSTPGWGTLTSANGYTGRYRSDQDGGGGIAIAEKSGQTSIQVDGDLYVHEGQDKVATVGQIPSIPSSLPANGGNSDTVDNEHASAFAHRGVGNNLITAGNEFNFIPSGYGGSNGGSVWINYETDVRDHSGNITEYILGKGNGQQLGTIIHSGNIGSQYVAYASLAGGVAWANVTGHPTDLNDFTNDAGYIKGINSSMVINALGYTPGTSSFTGYSSSNKLDGAYINNTQGWSSFSGYTSSNKLSTLYINGLATVATSGSYNDLSNKPTIPTVPTNISSFTNDVGYITSSGSCASATSAGSATISDNVSYLTTTPSSANTSGRLKFVVLSSEPSTKYDGYVYLILS